MGERRKGGEGGKREKGKGGETEEAGRRTPNTELKGEREGESGREGEGTGSERKGRRK